MSANLPQVCLNDPDEPVIRLNDSSGGYSIPALAGIQAGIPATPFIVMPAGSRHPVIGGTLQDIDHTATRKMMLTHDLQPFPKSRP